MTNSYIYFAKKYRETCGLIISRNKLTGNELHSGAIPLDVFFNELYVETDLFSKTCAIIDEATSLTKLIALCGPSGSGKSTTSLKVMNYIESDYRIKPIYVNLRPVASSKDFDTNEVNINKIRNLILAEFLKEFPASLGDELIDVSDEFIDLIYFLVSPEGKIKNYKTCESFNKYNKFVTKFGLLYQRHKQEGQNFEDFFRRYFFEKDCLDILLNIIEIIDVSDYIYYYCYKNKHRVIIWLDNIDAFENIQQNEIISIIHTIQEPIDGLLQIVISVREENIYRVGKFSDDNQAPFISKVSFSNIDNEELDIAYDSLNMPVMSSEQLQKLTEKKIRYTKKRLGYEIIKLTNDINETKTFISNPTLRKKYKIYQSTEQLKETLIKSIQKLEELENYIVNDEEFNDILKVNNIVNIAFKNEKVIYLANNSLKEYQKMHSGFFIFLLSNSQYYLNNRINIDSFDVSHIATEFLTWIFNVNESYSLSLLNIIADSFELKVKNAQVGCYLPYLVMTKIWNLNIKLKDNKSPYNNPTVERIVNIINSHFEYSKEDIINAIFDLQINNQGKGNFIVFRSKNFINVSSDIDLKTTVRLTYRGKTAISNTINSYGYLKKCVLDLNDNSLSHSKIESEILRVLTHLSEMHLNSLLFIRNNIYKNPNWYQNYLLEYGIPLDSSYCRNSNIGLEIEGRNPNNRALFLSTVFYSLNRYSHISNKFKKSLNFLENKFNNYLNRLIDNQIVNNIILEDEFI